MPDQLRKPDHVASLLRADEPEPEFFEFLMQLESAAEDIASDEVAMRGVFSYDE